MTNMDENGIRYTLFSCNSIDSDVLHELLYTHGKDLSYETAEKEEIAQQRSIWEDECESKSVAAQEAGTDCVLDDFETYLEDFEPQIEEPEIEGTYQDVHYRTTWLGGAQHLWVFKSPMLGHFDLCSPCVPGACNGEQRNRRADGFLGYDVPPDWLYKDPDDVRTFAVRLGEFE